MVQSFESLLSRTSLFQHVSRKDLSAFAGRVQPHHYQANQVVAEQGSLGTGLHVIIKGSVDVVHDRGKPNERHLAVLNEGDFFGELALLLDRLRGATIVTREPTDFFTLLRWDFEDLAKESPEVLWNMCKGMAERFAETVDIVQSM